MTVKSLKFFLAACILTSTSFGQSTISLDLIPHWKANETHTVKIVSKTTDDNKGTSLNYISTFLAKFLVKEADEKGFKVEWTYTNSKLSDNETALENEILAGMINSKFLIKVTDVGKFEELINIEETKHIANKVIDALIEKSVSNPSKNRKLKIAKQLISSNQGLEMVILKHIKFYYFSFGYSYELDYAQTNNIKIPSPFGGQPYDAVEYVKLTKLDNINSVCTIETNKVIDTKLLKLSIIDFIKKETNNNPQELEIANNGKLEMSENSMQQLDFSKGIVQKSFFKRTANFGFQNRITILEIETLD